MLTWPVLTVFGFIAQPQTPTFSSSPMSPAAPPRLTASISTITPDRPGTPTAACSSLPQRCDAISAIFVRADMIDLQSFIWVQGSDEYHWAPGFRNSAGSTNAWVQRHPPVQVRSGHPAGGADLTDDIAGLDLLTRFHIDRARGGSTS